MCNAWLVGRICCEIPVDKLPQSFETNAPFLGAGRGEGWICKRRAKKENLMQSELTELLVKSLYEVAWNLLRQLKENQEIHIRQKLALLSICLKMLHNITSYANFLQITLKSPWSRFPCLKGFHKWAFSSLKSFPFILIPADLRARSPVRSFMHVRSIHPSAAHLFVLPCLSDSSFNNLLFCSFSSSFVGPLVKSGGAKIEVWLGARYP